MQRVNGWRGEGCERFPDSVSSDVDVVHPLRRVGEPVPASARCSLSEKAAAFGRRCSLSGSVRGEVPRGRVLELLPLHHVAIGAEGRAHPAEHLMRATLSLRTPLSAHTFGSIHTSALEASQRSAADERM